MSDKASFAARSIHDQGDYCWGRHPVLTLLEEAPDRCLKIFLMKGAAGQAVSRILSLCREKKIPFQTVEGTILNRLCPGENHQGMIAQISAVPLTDVEPFMAKLPRRGPALLLALDHIQDPQNLGSMIRSAEVAGALAVLIPQRRSALPTGSVLKVSAGAALRVPLLSVKNLARTLETLKKDHAFWAVGLDHGASKTLWQEPLPERCLLVVGSESKGISPVVAKSCDDLRRIPMRGETGSLNASVAASIGLFEWLRGVDKMPQGR